MENFYCKKCNEFVGNPICPFCERTLTGTDIEPDDDIDNSMLLSNNMFTSFDENEHSEGN